jgi:hypothetical protein
MVIIFWKCPCLSSVGCEPDVAVTNIASSETVVGQGFSADVNITVANQDDLRF